MSSACWLTFHEPVRPLTNGPDRSGCAAELTAADGTVLGQLVAEWADDAPTDGAVKVDPRAVDPNGPAGWVSLVLAPPGRWLPFDDVAVSEAMRAALAGPPLDVCSTLLVGDDRFVGALSAVRSDRPLDERLADDPFARLFPARTGRVGPGLLGRTPAPVGPVIQRYGAANPWPWDRFEPPPPPEQHRSEGAPA